MIDKRNLPKPTKPINLNRPEDWAKIGWDENLSCFKLEIISVHEAPRVGWGTYNFNLQASDITELRDALTEALKAIGVEK
jgi:hypothetical protein